MPEENLYVNDQFDPCRRFDTIPACDRRRHTHSVARIKNHRQALTSCDAANATRLSVRPSFCLSVPCRERKTAHVRAKVSDYYGTLIRNPRWSLTHTGSGRNGNEAVAGDASETFARWTHHWYVPVELPSTAGILFRRSVRCSGCSGKEPPRSSFQRYD